MSYSHILILNLQQAHWPTHMSTCAQNQANQEEEGSSGPNSGGGNNAGHGAVPVSASQAVAEASVASALGIDPVSSLGSHFLSAAAAAQQVRAPSMPHRGLQVVKSFLLAFFS